MNVYELLRHEAAEKRDAIIRSARTAYREALVRIDELQRTINGYPAPRWSNTRKPLMALILDALPRDRLFYYDDIISAVRQVAPTRTINAGVVRNALGRLKYKGMIRRVRRGPKGVLWATVDNPEKTPPYGAHRLDRIAIDMLTELGPLTTAELVIVVHERGYRKGTAPKRLMQSFYTTMRRDPGQFQRNKEGKWELVG